MSKSKRGQPRRKREGKSASKMKRATWLSQQIKKFSGKRSGEALHQVPATA